MKNTILIMICIVLFMGICVGMVYHFRDRRTYELNLPELKELTSITLERNAKCIVISDNEQMKEILKVLYGMKRMTNQESIQDLPINIDNEIKIDFNMENGISTVFVYKKGSRYYIEQPYNGIYRISADEYNSIGKNIK